MTWLDVLPKDPVSLFTWLISVGCFALVVSLLSQRSTWFQGKTPKFRFWFIVMLAFVLPLLGHVGLVLLYLVGPTAFPPPLVPLGQPAATWVLFIYAYMVQCLANWGGTQIVHALDPAAKNGSKGIL
jgi:hypothetical protein